MRTRILWSAGLTFLLAACQKEKGIIPVNDNWPLFDSPQATALAPKPLRAMEGVYQVEEGTDLFGGLVAVKTNYVVTGTDTTYHLSAFYENDIGWLIMDGKRSGDSILLKGSWRKMVNTETGSVRLSIAAGNGATQLFGPNPVISPGGVVMLGQYGTGTEVPSKGIRFSYARKLFNGHAFEILAHRAGGRTSDLLQYSENSIEMMRNASSFGATGIEIDVRLTRDGVPVLYHDNTLNLRLIQKNGLVGPIDAFTYQQLYSQVRLIDGQRIPMLREALNTVVYETDLRFVWLDTKFEGSLEPIRALQAEFLQRAAAAGRQLRIVIGLPTEEALNSFKALPGYQNVPSLCELSLEDVDDINANIWAPRWTEGLQNEAVAGVKASGRQAFVWTLDVPEYIAQFSNEGMFDGILSNYPSLVAYNYYVKQ